MSFSFKQVFLFCFVLLKAVSCIPRSIQGPDLIEVTVETERKYNWHQAKHECARRDSRLVTIDSEAKNAAIIDILKNDVGGTHNLWLGGNDEWSSLQDFNRTFIWSATGKPFNFTNWSIGNPDNDKSLENCVQIWNNDDSYKWNDANCKSEMGFICESNRYYTE